jgi:hypothetical protein
MRTIFVLQDTRTWKVVAVTAAEIWRTTHSNQETIYYVHLYIRKKLKFFIKFTFLKIFKSLLLKKIGCVAYSRVQGIWKNMVPFHSFQMTAPIFLVMLLLKIVKIWYLVEKCLLQYVTNGHKFTPLCVSNPDTPMWFKILFPWYLKLYWNKIAWKLNKTTVEFSPSHTDCWQLKWFKIHFAW